MKTVNARSGKTSTSDLPKRADLPDVTDYILPMFQSETDSDVACPPEPPEAAEKPTHEQREEERGARKELNKTGAALKNDSKPEKAASESQARHWASLLTGNADLKDCGIEAAQTRLMEWLQYSADGILKDLSSFPELFQTTRFWSEIKAIESPLRSLKTLSGELQSGAFSFFDAIYHVGRNFGWEEEGLLKWKQGLEDVAGLARWMPSFTRACEYVSTSFPLGQDSIDHLREALLQSVHEPHRFLESKVRTEFEEKFIEFKKGYIDTYFILHEDALHIMSGLKKDEQKIDSQALRNLDLFSGLQYTDKSYLNRVKLLARWIQHNQCNLPLDQILEHYPRCFCNFNPGIHQQPADCAAQINSIIQEGLEYFRAILRRCGQLIMMDIDANPIEDSILKQINAALSDGPMIPMKAQAIEMLNKIILRNSTEFLAEIRKTSIKTAG
jgi:hypothetical protein